MGLPDPLASSIRRMGVAMAGDLGAGIAKRYGNGGAETGRSAGDESNSIVKSKHGSQKIFAQGRKNIDQHHFLDRKSTRLNSSHSQISYAVFCLKKKNKIPK